MFTTPPGSQSGVPQWIAVRPSVGTALRDARLQTHHAVQLVAALGAAYLPPQPDDSHTNLEWIREHRSLFSNVIPTSKAQVRFGLRTRDLTLLVLWGKVVSGSFSMNGRTLDHAIAWIRSEVGQAALDPTVFTTARSYEIPPHPVASGAAFDNRRGDHLDALSAWFANAALLLEPLRTTARGTAVRCWPHHYDLATLIRPRPDQSIGVGLEPGDQYYDEPYFYVNVHPQPSADAVQAVPLGGGGRWHTRDWIGAVLPTSCLDPDAASQEAQVKQFIGSAVDAVRRLLT